MDDGKDAGLVPYPAGEVERYLAAGYWRERSIPTAFRDSVALHGERTALITAEGRLSYRELDQVTDAVAAGLLGAGLEPGERVLLQLTNSDQAIQAWYGVLKAGLIPVCALAIHRRHEIEQIARHTNAAAHLIQADFRGFDLLALAGQIQTLVPSVRLTLTVGAAPDTPGIRIEDLARTQVDAARAARLVEVAHALKAHDPAVFQLSGGTTGTPKVIPRLHAEYWYNAQATSTWWGHDHTSVLAVGLPFVHNAGLSNAVHAAHAVGAALLLIPGAAADTVLPLMAEHGATWTVTPPGLVREYAEHPGFPAAVASLTSWMLSAAKVPPAVFDLLTGHGIHVTQAFGMSEGMFMFTPSDAPAALRAGTIGVPISPLDEIRILVPGTETEVAPGEVGELAARGPYTIRGYFDAADRDLEAFTSDGFYRSGDLMRAQWFEGQLGYSLEGRVKDLIDRGGEKINAEEVEGLLLRHPRVREVALVAMPDPRLGERACAFVVAAEDGPPPTLEQFCAHLHDLGVAKYKWPERVEYLDDLPRTEIGKVSKVTLREMVAGMLRAAEAQAQA
ncbi:MAG TPA: AMP-binding protein [Actinocrinis sp.]|nr:AMP-binding protein [Actinocrinis sp.]